MTFRGTPFETTMKFFSVRMLSIRDKATHRNQKLRETLLTRLSVTACVAGQARSLPTLIAVTVIKDTPLKT